MPTRSYPFGELDPSRELARLEAQVRLVAGLEGDFLARAGLQGGHTLLDLGCGPGFFAEAAVERVPQGRVIGVDADPALLAIARARVGDRLTLLEGTVTAIPLPDASVDFTYCRFVFQHLPEPARALVEMRRVTRPGGVVAVVDTDDGGLLLHPAPAGVDRLLVASRDAQAARGGDREVGRKLRSLLVDAGLEEVGVQVYPFTTEEVGAAAFLGIAFGFKAGVIGLPWMDPLEAARVTESVRVAASAPGFFGQALGFGAWGRAPGGRV